MLWIPSELILAFADNSARSRESRVDHVRALLPLTRTLCVRRFLVRLRPLHPQPRRDARPQRGA